MFTITQCAVLLAIYCNLASSKVTFSLVPGKSFSNWEDARAGCESVAANLANFWSSEELYEASKLLGGGIIAYTSLKYNNVRNNWIWEAQNDDTTLAEDSKQWLFEGYPENEDEKCAFHTPDSKLIDDWCNRGGPALCMTGDRNSQPENTVPPVAVAPAPMAPPAISPPQPPPNSTTTTATAKPTTIETADVHAENLATATKGTGSVEAIAFRSAELLPPMPTERFTPKVISDDLKSAPCQDFTPKRSVPPNNGNRNDVDATFILDQFLGISDVDERLQMSGILQLRWNITTCSKSSTLPGLDTRERVFLADEDSYWMPPLTFRSSFDDAYMKSEQLGDDFIFVVDPLSLNDNLTMSFYWSKIGTFTSRCQLNLRKFPFDYQTCSFQFGLHRSVKLVSFRNVDMLPPIQTRQLAQWEVLEGTEKAEITTIPVGTIGSHISVASFELTFKRRPQFYIWNFIAPSLLLAILAFGVFLIPNGDADRATFAITILLSLTVAQSQVSASIPQTAEQILLSEYIFYLGLHTAIICTYCLIACFLSNLKVRNGKQSRFAKVLIANLSKLEILEFFIGIASLLAIHIYACLIIANY